MNLIWFQIRFSAALTTILVVSGVYKLITTGESNWFQLVVPLVTLWLPSPAGIMKEWGRAQTTVQSDNIDNVTIESNEKSTDH